jgi:hypothetical protein
LNRIASEKAEQLEEALVDAEIDNRLKKYIMGVGDRSGFDAVHCAPGSTSDVPDDGGNLRLVVLGVKNHHQNSRPNSEGMAEAKKYTYLSWLSSACLSKYDCIFGSR